jgi:hypothetical protein
MQIATSVQALPAISPNNIVKWEKQVTLVLILSNNCLKNSIISHVQSKITLKEAWVELTNIFKSKDVIPKIL